MSSVRAIPRFVLSEAIRRTTASSLAYEDVVVGVGGQHHYACLGELGLDRPSGLYAAHPRHGDVHEYQVRARLPAARDGPFAVFGLADHLEGGAGGQDGPRAHPHQGVIVYDDKPGPRGLFARLGRPPPLRCHPRHRGAERPFFPVTSESCNKYRGRSFLRMG